MQIICLIILLLVVNVFVMGQQSDIDALLEVKRGIKEEVPYRKSLASWDSNSLDSDGCPHNWYGVSCSSGRVTSITLDDSGLVGDFNFAAISGLTMLRNLSLSNNQLTGTVSMIGLIKSLEFVDLSCNMFHDSVPSLLTNLNHLVLFNLSFNQFEGTFPSGIGKLEKLKYFNLRANGFSGDIMNLLSQMGSVLYVDLSSNRFSGSLDLGLGNLSIMPSIQYLNVSHNLLGGELFTHDGMPYFDSLEVFDASNNQFVGNIPSFSLVFSLRILRLGSNQLSGFLPEALFQESSSLLSELDLSLNELEGPIGSITSGSLKTLNISSNKLTGSLPASIGHCAIIDLSHNMLSGNLSRIQSWGNYVEVIRLSSNSLTGTLLNQTSQFLRLTSFEVSNNSLEGVLPPVLGTYPELKLIDLSFNQLTGPLLSSFFNSTKLTVINLSNNKFNGSIPVAEMLDPTSTYSSQNSSMISLDLSHNSLTGHLPEELSMFYRLVLLNLSNNNFQGVIPNELPDGLQVFDVSFNNLSGIIPENLRRFPESVFHPGNSLLVFPYSPSPPNDVPGLTVTTLRSHMKPAMRIALIVGSVGAVAMVAIVCIMIYYRARWREHRRSISVGNVGKNEGSSVICKSEPTKNEICSSNIAKEVPPSSNKAFSPEYSESLKKEENLSSPMSLMSSSNPSPSKNQQQLPDNPSLLKVRSPDKMAGDLHLFDGSLAITAEELSRAPAEIIGRSCHGILYKATLDSGHTMAVKWLREGMAKGRKEFAREVKKLGSIKHPSLVSVIGYYWGPKDHEKLLISNFLNAHSLAFYLQETEARRVPPLSLDERLRIGVDVARCLNYLHNEKAIPHGNLKSTNVLLESPAMNAQLTDYSLHRILTPAGTAEQVLNAGALGYRPPEFASSSKPCPSLKSDVYAFGVILLELLTGRSSGEIVCGIPGVVDLTDWVRFLAGENHTFECLDNMILERNSTELRHKLIYDMLQAALRCTLPASERPDMKTVFEDLSKML